MRKRQKEIRPEILRRDMIEHWDSPQQVLRDEIGKSGLTGYEIEHLTRVPRQTVARFVNAERGISADTFCKLLAVVGMTVLTASGNQSYHGKC
jgi:plasmid maintenance system antidote protein VapI